MEKPFISKYPKGREKKNVGGERTGGPLTFPFLTGRGRGKKGGGEKHSLNTYPRKRGRGKQKLISQYGAGKKEEKRKRKRVFFIPIIIDWGRRPEKKGNLVLSLGWGGGKEKKGRGTRRFVLRRIGRRQGGGIV